MTDYDPRTATGIPTELVGSLPRPAKLQAAYADYDAGKITREHLEEVQDEAVRDSISRFEATGSPIVSDGEQRASSFATYPVTDTLAGTGLADHLRPYAGQHGAVRASLSRCEATEAPIVSDGEQRTSSFWPYPADGCLAR